MGRVSTRKAKAKKSVMGRLGALSLEQRQDVALLVAQGIPEAEARAIAQGYAMAKADVRKAAPTSDYYEAFHAASRRMLPDWQHRMLHQHARGKAGAAGRQRSRMREDDVKGALLAEMEALQKRMRHIQEEVGKASPLASEVHVPVPMGERKKRETVIKRADGAPNISAKELAYVQAAYGLQQPLESAALEAGMVPPEADALVQANRLVAGMDAELQAGATDPEDARRRASRNLMERPGLYDSIGATPETRGLHGLLLDVGSGPARAPGHLGLDLYPHDHGTVLHDVELGLPFPDGSVRAIRLHNSLHEILDAPGANPDPTRLLTECQRVLCEGGCVYYAGPEPLIEEGQRWAMPGLVLLHQNRDGTDQVLRRVPLRYPAYHGADADFSPGPELPLDVQMALTAANTSRAERAMANLIHKSEPRMVPIIKADKMRQIVTGVVLEPHSEDLQGDWMTPEDIERAAHGYLIGSRIVGSEHGRPIDANVVESYITPQDMTFATAAGQELVPQGSWVMSVKITSPEEWQQVLDGDYGGFSVGGYGAREEAA